MLGFRAPNRVAADVPAEVPACVAAAGMLG